MEEAYIPSNFESPSAPSSEAARLLCSAEQTSCRVQASAGLTMQPDVVALSVS